MRVKLPTTTKVAAAAAAGNRLAIDGLTLPNPNRLSLARRVAHEFGPKHFTVFTAICSCHVFAPWSLNYLIGY